MWPLKNKIFYVGPGNVKFDDDGNTLTLIHNKGANRFTKNDVLNYSFESDIFSPSVEDYSMINKVLLFALFGGFLNMFQSLFPANVWSDADGGVYRSEIWFNSLSGSLFHGLILIGLAILFSYSVYLIIIYLLKQYRISKRLNKYRKDIITISLNNVQMKVRINRWNEDRNQEVLLFLGADPENTLSHSSNKFNLTAPLNLTVPPELNFRHLGILSLIIIPIFLLNYDVPFWFYQLEIPENIIRNSFLSSRFSNETMLYWKYYGTWDGNGGIVNVTHPVKAFFDGALSNAVFPILLFYGLMIGTLLILVALICLILLALGYGFGGVLALLLFFIVFVQINNNSNSKNWRLIKTVNWFLRFFGEPSIVFSILFLILFIWIGVLVYDLGESMIGENYKYYSWSGSFILILSTFLLVKKKVFQKREYEITCPRCLGKGHVDEADIVRLNRTAYWGPGGPCAYCEGLGIVNSELLARVDPDDVYLTLSLSPEERERYRNKNN